MWGNGCRSEIDPFPHNLLPLRQKCRDENLCIKCTLTRSIRYANCLRQCTFYVQIFIPGAKPQLLRTHSCLSAAESPGAGVFAPFFEVLRPSHDQNMGAGLRPAHILSWLGLSTSKKTGPECGQKSPSSLHRAFRSFRLAKCLQSPGQKLWAFCPHSGPYDRQELPWGSICRSKIDMLPHVELLPCRPKIGREPRSLPPNFWPIAWYKRVRARHMCAHTCTYAHAHMLTHNAHTHVRAHVWVHMRVHMCTCICARVCAHVPMHVRARTHACTCASTCTCVYVYVHACTHT